MARTDSVPTLITLIFDLRTQIAHLLGTEPPQLLPPAPATLVTSAEQRLNFSFPPFFREFLRISDGFLRFSEGFDLLGVRQMLSDDYARQVKKIRDLAWQGGDRVGVEGFLVGVRPGSFRVLLFDRTVERDERGELPAVEWKFESLARTPDFHEFLVLWHESAEKTLAEAQKLAASDRSKPPEQ